MPYRPLARGICAAVNELTGGVQRHPTHLDFFARQAKNHQVSHPTTNAFEGLNQARKRRRRENGLNISGNGENTLLRRPVFDPTRLYLLFGSLHTRVPQGAGGDDTLIGKGTGSWRFKGGTGAGDSCTFNGVRRRDNGGLNYRECE